MHSFAPGRVHAEESQTKIDELADAHANRDILLEGVPIATVFLGSDLRIRSFTPSISGIINLLASDVGRSLRDITERRQAEVALRELNTMLENKVAQRTAELEHRAR